MADPHRPASAAVLQSAASLDRAVRRVAGGGTDALRALLNAHRSDILRRGAAFAGPVDGGSCGRHPGDIALSRPVCPGNAHVRAAHAGGGVRPVFPGAPADQAGRARSRLGRPGLCAGACDADPQHGCRLSTGCAECGDGHRLPAVSIRVWPWERGLGEEGATGGVCCRAGWSRDSSVGANRLRCVLEPMDQVPGPGGLIVVALGHAIHHPDT